MNDDEFRANIDAEIASAQAWAGEHLEEDRLRNLAYYMGEPMGNEVQGRSRVVSRDVFEVIESAMPTFLEPFFSGDNVGVYEPRGVEDEAYADQATDYINVIIKDRNEGFMVFNTWIKDGLLNKLGIVRVDVEDRDTVRKYSVTQDELLQMLELGAEVEAQEPQPDGTILVSAKEKRPKHFAIRGVEPEHFIISSGIKSAEDARIIGEMVTYTRSDLKEAGISKWDAVGDYVSRTDSLDEYRHDSSDESMEEVTLFEGFIRADRNGDGKAEWRRVMVGDEIVLEEDADDHNYALWSPISVPHRVVGLAYADVAATSQEISTALIRQYIDSLFQANRPRTYLNRQSNVNIDQLLDGSIGAVVEGDGPMNNAIAPLVTNNVARDSLEGVEMARSMRERWTGITAYNQGLDADTLNKTATGISKIFGAAEKRQQMTLRVFAETGVKRLFKLLLALVTKHQDVEDITRLRGTFVRFDPRGWSPEMDVSIDVGTGSGDKTETMMMLQRFEAFMQIAAQAGVVTPRNIYEYGKMLAKAAKLKGADTRLLTEPSDQPEPRQEDPKLAIDRERLNLEREKAQSGVSMDREKMGADMQAAQMRAEVEIAKERMRLEFEAAQRQADREMALMMKRVELESGLATHFSGLEDGRAARDEAGRRDELKRTEKADKAESGVPWQEMLAAQGEAMQALVRRINAPRRLIRDESGRAVGVETIEESDG